jgi:hypothetical protein
MPKTVSKLLVLFRSRAQRAELSNAELFISPPQNLDHLLAICVFRPGGTLTHPSLALQL